MWDPAAWGNTHLVTFTSTEDGSDIWVPDLCVYETIDAQRIYDRVDYQVTHRGEVTISVPMRHALFCPMYLNEFPFDDQKCSFTVGSWTHNGHKLDLVPWVTGVNEANPIDLSEYPSMNSEFVLTKVLARHVIKYYGVSTTPYPTLVFTIFLERAASVTYFSGIILPMIMSTLVGFLAFITNPAAGERVGLGITVLLTQAAIYLVLEVRASARALSALALSPRERAVSRARALIYPPRARAQNRPTCPSRTTGPCSRCSTLRASASAC